MVTNNLGHRKAPKSLRQALALRQVGATKVGNFYKVGGGYFTKEEVLNARYRYGKAKAGPGAQVTKSMVGL